MTRASALDAGAWPCTPSPALATPSSLKDLLKDSGNIDDDKAMPITFCRVNYMSHKCETLQRIFATHVPLC